MRWKLLLSTPEVPCRVSRLHIHQLQGWLRAVVYTVDIRRVVFITRLVEVLCSADVASRECPGCLRDTSGGPSLHGTSSSTGDSISSRCSDYKQLGRLPAITAPRFPACTAWRFESSQAFW